MDEFVICNRCGESFSMGEISQITDGDIEVQFFCCTNCGKAYHILTTDSEMRKLIDQRCAVARKISRSIAAKCREKTLRRHMQEDAKIKKAQEAIAPELKKRGEELIEKLIPHNGKEYPAEEQNGAEPGTQEQ